MKTSPRDMKCAFALLIGINEYRAYDPSGKSDLLAGKPDVGAFYRACRRLGIPGENIHVLTSPKTTLEALGAADGNVGIDVEGVGQFGEATGAGIRAELAWLAGKLTCAPGDADAPIGLLTYSGHGAFANGELSICPSDVRAEGGVLQGAIGFGEVERILGEAAQNLTIVLDCCHAGAAAAAGDPEKQRSANAPLTAETPPADLRPAIGGARLLLAAKPGELAHQSIFDGRHHGALTWAATVVLEQWTMMREGDVNYETITHEDLRDRAQKLLDALSFGQTVVLAPESAASVPFFHRGKRDARDVVTNDPDRARPAIQVDPDWIPGDWHTLYPNNTKPDWAIYQFQDASNNTVAAVLAVRKSGSPGSGALAYFQPAEYWSLSSSASLSTAVEVTATAGPWYDKKQRVAVSPPKFPLSDSGPIYSMPTNVTWPSPEPGSTPDATIWGNVAGSSPPAVFGLAVRAPDWMWQQGTPSGAADDDYVIQEPAQSNQGVQNNLLTGPPAGSYSWSQVQLTATAPTFGGLGALNLPLFDSGVASVGLAANGGTFYLAVEAPAATVTLFTSTDGGVTWTQPQDGVLNDAQGPSLAVLDGVLYAFCYSGSDSNYSISMATWNQQWATSPIASELSQQPNLAATTVGGAIYVAYWDGTTIQYRKSSDEYGSSYPVAPPSETSFTAGPIGLSCLSGAPYLSAPVDGDTKVGQLASFDTTAQSSSPGVLSSNQNSSMLALASPSAPGGTISIVSSTDGSTWTPQPDVPSLTGTLAAMASLGNGQTLLVSAASTAVFGYYGVY